MTEKLGIVPFWKGYDRKAVIKMAKAAEDMGYHSIWVPEAWSYEQFQLLAEIAVHTKRLGLATGIANVFSRSAGLLAMYFRNPDMTESDGIRPSQEGMSLAKDAFMAAIAGALVTDR